MTKTKQHKYVKPVYKMLCRVTGFGSPNEANIEVHKNFAQPNVDSGLLRIVVQGYGKETAAVLLDEHGVAELVRALAPYAKEAENDGF